MSSKSLNKVMLIGNLTRDPELKYTPQGTAVCTFGMATNREWTDSSGQKQEDAQFHRLVVWGKLAEICAEILNKGRKVYVQGRLQTRSWQTNEGQDRQSTEVVVDEMIALGAPRNRDGGDFIDEDFGVSAAETDEDVFNPEGEVVKKAKKTVKKVSKSPVKGKKKETKQADVNDDIPF